MTPIAKDLENPAPAASGVPSAPAAKAPADASARPQPVALEVPVTINGARTLAGSDKREPFSESSQTVLVFGHGAVIRIAAVLSPGQLIFLTNEKTKKEVVCQVVKSKTDGNAVGYVELRFTEPAPGFWGMRFPSDTVIPQAAPRPSAPAPAPAAPKSTPPAPPVTVAKPVVTAPAAPPKPVVPPPPAPVAASAELPKFLAPALPTVPPVVVPKVSAPLPEPQAPVAAPPLAAKPELLAPPEPVNEPAPAVIVPTPVVSAPESKAPLASSPAPLSSSSDPSTEELKQQAARLQEQLSSMLFTETPKPPVSTLTVPPAKETIPAPEVAQKILELASATPEVTPGKPLKTIAPPSPKSAPSSIASEEIKIPSWLAPLARETQSQNSEAANSEVAQSEVGQESEVPDSPEATFISELQESSRRPETAVFGGQLLGESSQSSDAPASGSKTGLFIGIAAALLLIAGGAWYSRQPGNAISSLFGGNSPSSQPAATSSLVPAASVAKSVAAPVAVSNSASAPSSVNLPAPVAPVNNNPSAAMAVNANPSAPSASRNTPHLEEPKKPALGDVRLATPVIGHPGAESAVGESEPSIDVNSSANSPSPVSALVSGHKAEPTAPLPIGGDVKPAQLLKSVPPVYPQMARNQHVVGNVQIDALIDADGHVSAMKVLAGPTLLHQAALDALKQWKYQPAELDGKPTAMHLTVTIQFRAQ